jgi:hypothetical protein
MRQHCELCAALGAESPPRNKLIGVGVGSRDALLCADHALFALDSDVESLAELRELYEFVALVEPSPDEMATARVARRGGSRDAARASRSVP